MKDDVIRAVDAPTVQIADQLTWMGFFQAYTTLLENRPTDRSPRARHYAVAITDMEKLLAYFQTYVIHGYVATQDAPESASTDMVSQTGS
jgi:hypothetical protein